MKLKIAICGNCGIIRARFINPLCQVCGYGEFELYEIDVKEIKSKGG